MSVTIHLSDRQLPLVYQEIPRGATILTVENYCKWYSVYCVSPDKVYKLPNWFYTQFLELNEPFAVNHVFTPRFCRWLGQYDKFEWDVNSLELIYGRWFTEIERKFCEDEMPQIVEKTKTEKKLSECFIGDCVYLENSEEADVVRILKLDENNATVTHPTDCSAYLEVYIDSKVWL